MLTLLRSLVRGRRVPQQICHFSFHKNLTVYYGKVAADFAAETGRTYTHFNSFHRAFRQEAALDMRSLNNHCMDLDAIRKKTPHARFSLFLRDPRDLVVSGYFYHKRGAEAWSRAVDPTDETLATVNLRLPKRFLRPGESIATCFQRLSDAEGLDMEIEMRRPHFEAMRQWLRTVATSPHLMIKTYDAILADETSAFADLADHYHLSETEKQIWVGLATKYAARNLASEHIRNPSSAQWKQVLSAQQISLFDAEYADLLEPFRR
ncbi:hypothetical protein [Pseudohoeflea coraliihabitans]|uniref:Sulfotransferase domain-containing protein n=1 Tax=Pseudohoeflea coraliihabitans TaxID=2860393 RepID=A0ABS6WSX2_9HYPH|nr:hypothetical protein [Pseudohoeflea sp. DP4N28-3]MBW3099053.1 hypothetical protein [Pseudohoeflea sp. DP4N28-3]